MRMHVNFPKFLENRITSEHLRYTIDNRDYVTYVRISVRSTYGYVVSIIYGYTDLCEVADFYCVEDAYHNHALCEG